MKNIKEIIQPILSDFKINLDDTAYDRLQKYFEILVDYNSKVNLTAITDVEGVAIKHFADCLEVFNYVDIKKGAKVIDVGTGAGFPGVVLKIARPDIELCLLDSLNKRLVFLDTLLNKLGLDAELVHSRAEEGARKAQMRDSFDFAFSRAVARLNVLSEYCLPYVKTGGAFVSLKGPDIDEEIKQAQNAFRVLNAKAENVYKFNLPCDGSQRAIVVVRKCSSTPKQYPRVSAKIKTKPL